VHADDHLESWASSAPFSQFTGETKCIRLDQSEDWACRALAAMFGEFFADEKENVEGKRLIKDIHLGLERGPNAQPYRYRRFAGGPDLPRGRYYTLASDSDGYDGNTLAEELAAYRSPAPEVLSIQDSAALPVAMRTAMALAIEYFDIAPQTLLVFAKRARDTPRWWASMKRSPDGSNACAQFQYVVQPEVIEKVIDLRLQSTQSWLYDLLTNSGMPGVGYYYSPNILSERLVVNGERPKTQPELSISNYHGGSNRLVWLPPRPDWDRIPRDGPLDFLGVLPFLIFPGRGGSPITEAIGRHVRRIGADALIYPSCRADVTATTASNTLSTAGWNLVDYRGATTQLLDAWIIVSPDSWWGLRSNADVRVTRSGLWEVASV
jgi:hypothetical protein